MQSCTDIPTGRSDHEPSSLRTTVIRFAGGPWGGRSARYVHPGELTPMLCPGGHYRLAQHDRDGTAVYAFTRA